jgi:hypothetical protein
VARKVSSRQHSRQVNLATFATSHQDGHEADAILVTESDGIRWSLHHRSAPIAEYERLVIMTDVVWMVHRSTGYGRSLTSRSTGRREAVSGVARGGEWQELRVPDGLGGATVFCPL